MTKEKFDEKVKACAVSLCDWIGKTRVKAITIETRSVSGYYYNDGTHPMIVFGADCDWRAIGHEYGHSIFNVVFDEYGTYPDCKEVKSACDELCADCFTAGYKGVVISEYLDKKCSEYKVNRRAFTPISDIMGMYVDTTVIGYTQHSIGYAEKFVGFYGYDEPNLIYEDEWFASICGLIYEGNWNALKAIHEMYPVAVESCFDVMDKAIEILKERAKEARDKYFTSTVDTFVCIETPWDVLTLLRLKLVWMYWRFCI